MSGEPASVPTGSTGRSRRPPISGPAPPAGTGADGGVRIGITLSDGELLRLGADGHVLAFDALFDRHRRGAVALAARVCGAGLAEEAVQEAFLQISRAGDAYRPAIGPVTTWLLGIVRLRAIDAGRRDARHSQRRADADELADLAGGDHTEATVARRYDAGTVRSMLSALPEDQARVIALAYFGGLTHAEIAGLTGLPIGTVKGRIRLGLVKLRHSVAPDCALAPGV